MKKSREQRKKLKAKAAKRFEQELKNVMPLEEFMKLIEVQRFSFQNDMETALLFGNGHFKFEVDKNEN